IRVVVVHVLRPFRVVDHVVMFVPVVGGRRLVVIVAVVILAAGVTPPARVVLPGGILVGLGLEAGEDAQPQHPGETDVLQHVCPCLPKKTRKRNPYHTGIGNTRANHPGKRWDPTNLPKFWKYFWEIIWKIPRGGWGRRKRNPSRGRIARL